MNWLYIKLAQLDNTEACIDHNFVVLESTRNTIKAVMLAIIASPLIAYIYAIFYP